jgi:hypothetical protein
MWKNGMDCTLAFEGDLDVLRPNCLMSHLVFPTVCFASSRSVIAAEIKTQGYGGLISYVIDFLGARSNGAVSTYMVSVDTQGM